MQILLHYAYNVVYFLLYSNDAVYYLIHETCAETYEDAKQHEYYCDADMSNLLVNTFWVF